MLGQHRFSTAQLQRPAHKASQEAAHFKPSGSADNPSPAVHSGPQRTCFLELVHRQGIKELVSDVDSGHICRHLIQATVPPNLQRTGHGLEESALVLHLHPSSVLVLVLVTSYKLVAASAAAKTQFKVKPAVQLRTQ